MKAIKPRSRKIGTAKKRKARRLANVERNNK